MQQQFIQEIVEELKASLSERFLGRVFQLSQFSLAIDFGVRNAGYLFISAEPAQPRLYLIKRTARELEKHSQPLSHFTQAVRAKLGGGKLVAISKDEKERVIRLQFLIEDEIGKQDVITLICQLTGRSANLFLLDAEDQIRHALRPPKGAGQQLGEHYRPPAKQLGGGSESPSESVEFDRKGFANLSQALDEHYTKLESSQNFLQRAQQVRNQMKKEIAQRKKLKRNLERDLAHHGNPEEHKRLGDLLLANIATATRSGNTVKIKDYYSEGAPEISLELEKGQSLQDAAGVHFDSYAKAKRALGEITARLAKLEPEILKLEQQQVQIERIIAAEDEAGLAKYEAAPIRRPSRGKKTSEEKLAGVRRYLSSDDYEILVGRAALTNDKLTFKVARPHDLWLHAADYPGSHVVVRNPNRKEIPHRTIVEAAQLAAKFSQAGDDSKVIVHYTQRKFLAKPKGAAPGLVRISAFKTLTVTPAETIPRL